MPQPHPFDLSSSTSAAMAANSRLSVPSAAGAGGEATIKFPQPFQIATTNATTAFDSSS